MLFLVYIVDVTVLGLVGGAPGGETPRVADSSAAGAGPDKASASSKSLDLGTRIGKVLSARLQ